MSDSTSSSPRTSLISLPMPLAIALGLLLVGLFLILLFPWDALSRRITWEITRASGSQITIESLAPSLSARGPVLAARDVLIEHPAVSRVAIATLEIAPRLSTSWLAGEPTLRVWADTDLGIVDGVLRLGEASAYVGRFENVEIERLPLRLGEGDLHVAGTLAAEANVSLDPAGLLRGTVEFAVPSLLIESSQLVLPIQLEPAEGALEILETGATRIERFEFGGPIVEGNLSGEVGLAHRSQSPPVDLEAQIHVVAPALRELAPGLGLRLSPDGDASIAIRGTLASPEIEPRSARAGR